MAGNSRNQLLKQLPVDDCDLENGAIEQDKTVVESKDDCDSGQDQITQNDEEDVTIQCANATTDGAQGGVEEKIEEDPEEKARRQLLSEYEDLASRVIFLNETPPVLDNNNENMVVFVTRLFFADRPTSDKEKIMDCYHFLLESILPAAGEGATASASVSVTWEQPDTRMRMLMHKLCAFYGLDHNIVSQGSPNSVMKIDYIDNKFMNYPVTLIEMERYWQLKRELGLITREDEDTYGGPVASAVDAKSILKRTPNDSRLSIMSESISGAESCRSLEERQHNYNRRRQEIGVGNPSAGGSKRAGNKSVHKGNSMPEQPVTARLAADRRTVSLELCHQSLLKASCLTGDQSSSLTSQQFNLNGGYRGNSQSDNTPPDQSELTPYQVAPDTAVFTLAPVSLNSVGKEIDIFVLDKQNRPLLLLNGDGSAYRHDASGASSALAYVRPMESSMSSSCSMPIFNSRFNQSAGDSFPVKNTSTPTASNNSTKRTIGVNNNAVQQQQYTGGRSRQKGGSPSQPPQPQFQAKNVPMTVPAYPPPGMTGFVNVAPYPGLTVPRLPLHMSGNYFAGAPINNVLPQAPPMGPGAPHNAHTPPTPHSGPSVTQGNFYHPHHLASIQANQSQRFYHPGPPEPANQQYLAQQQPVSLPPVVPVVPSPHLSNSGGGYASYLLLPQGHHGSPPAMGHVMGAPAFQPYMAPQHQQFVPMFSNQGVRPPQQQHGRYSGANLRGPRATGRPFNGGESHM